MGDYASKGVAGTGLGVGIAGLSLGVLNSANNGNGLLGGLFGGNGNMVSQLQAENAMLRAENYSDKNSKDVYMQSLSDNRNLRNEMYAFIKPLADEAANNRVELATLRAEQKCCCEKQELREQILVGKINEVALSTKGRFDTLDQTISCLANSVQNNANAIANITSTIVPLSKICPEPMARYNSFVVPTETKPAPAA